MGIDPVIKEMIESGAMHETQAPFDRQENKFDEGENKEDKIKLPYTLKLQDPFDFMQEGKITELKFINRLTTEHTMHLPIGVQHKRGHYVPVIAGMLGKPEAFVKLISPGDFMECVNVALDFF